MVWDRGRGGGGGGAGRRAHICCVQVHEGGVEADENVGADDGEERPEEGEAPDAGEGVEVGRRAGGGADGPVEGGEGWGGVGERDLGGAQVCHFALDPPPWW